MRFIKQICLGIFGLILIQLVTFYTIGKNSLIDKIGEHYETFVFDYGDNHFDNVGIISNLEITNDEARTNFVKFKESNVFLCNDFVASSELKKTKDFYIYHILYESQNPFWINKVYEYELVNEFGATWESEYIWALYKWILIEKNNTGIS
ncbi:hypothetical protein [Aureibacter tunicatorum]|uniref:Uncharacterized protein n=1 Tax=Aureibacter tunicatorum TaxID=866807 RepID=A0AAE3XQJ6_9BACT|nr:hypothetical protein [Aureibacter tunicatorum]MDR6240091.1 hypothetical protein [Aureibacter tunicatorum]BDD04562.1 hypothetical protein AUTU_20450 [Aureibacter tunicatorum]